MALEDLLISESESETDSDSAESDSDEDLIQECYNTLNLLDSLNAMDEEDEARNSRTIIRRRRLHRDRIDTGNRLFRDYFSDNPTFPGDYFRNRFRMSKSLFMRIGHAILTYNSQPRPDYFKFFDQRYNSTAQLGFNIFQKCTSVIRQLAYGIAPDAFDEYLHMGASTSRDCLKNYCKCIIHMFSREYLRKPTEGEVRRLHAKHLEMHGFPGMLGSLDCMHWSWKNCPVAWQGHYHRGDHEGPTIMLEVVASYDMWIWHAFFGPAGSNNDINVLNESDLFEDLLDGRAPEVRYTINTHKFTKGYYLVDGIHPEWATLVKSFKCPLEPKNVKFKRFQEAARKDVERAFGVLQGRWAILKHPARPFSINKIRRIMYTCVILHNMITEDNERNICDLEEDYLRERENMPRRTWTERIALQDRVD
ncbi:uncharacterized protein [Rutidosis leptorrhynchoides]|uniref:uncharacterized protein n=1 Tax=Rutidosis leptorrhynchoides TaxID=125765 RepID=UPI003A998A96